MLNIHTLHLKMFVKYMKLVTVKGKGDLIHFILITSVDYAFCMFQFPHNVNKPVEEEFMSSES